VDVDMSSRRVGFRATILLSAILYGSPARAQIIEFESGGLKFKTLTRNGLTIMFAPLAMHVRDYAILQIAISNGSTISWAVKPEDFSFEGSDGHVIQALPARTVVDTLMQKARRGDVIKLVTAYESGLSGNAQVHSTNGYEARRQSAQADLGSTKLKAAAAASAIALVTTKLKPGESTDGAIFYANQGKPLGAGQLIVHAAGETFTFPMEPEPHSSRP
jgi:hypothetical protein